MKESLVSIFGTPIKRHIKSAKSFKKWHKYHHICSRRVRISVQYKFPYSPNLGRRLSITTWLGRRNMRRSGTTAVSKARSGVRLDFVARLGSRLHPKTEHSKSTGPMFDHIFTCLSIDLQFVECSFMLAEHSISKSNPAVKGSMFTP